MLTSFYHVGKITMDFFLGVQLHFTIDRKKRTTAASEEACSIPLPPGRRKLHIRSLLLPSRKPTAVLGRLSVPIRKGKRRPENLSDGSLDSPSTRALLWSCGVWKSWFFRIRKKLSARHHQDRVRRGVRRSQMHSASAEAAKAPYPLAPSSFPNCDRCAGLQFGVTWGGQTRLGK